MIGNSNIYYILTAHSISLRSQNIYKPTTIISLCILIDCLAVKQDYYVQNFLHNYRKPKLQTRKRRILSVIVWPFKEKPKIKSDTTNRSTGHNCLYVRYQTFKSNNKCKNTCAILFNFKRGVYKVKCDCHQEILSLWFL